MQLISKVKFMVSVILSCMIITAAAAGPIDSIRTPLIADISVRFQHIEPRVSIPGLLAAWTIDEGSGYEFQDLCGNGNTAYLTGNKWNSTNSGLTTSFRKVGKRGGAVYIDGSQWLQVQDNSSLNSPSAKTLALWIKPAHTAAGETILFSNQTSSGGFSLLYNAGHVLIEYPDDRHKLTSAAVPARISVNEWTHLAFTTDPAAKQVRFYINGRLAGLQSGIKLQGSGVSDLFIGGGKDFSKSSFNGCLDEICLYNTVLAATEISRLYTNGLPALYTRFRSTIDAGKSQWTAFRGNQPVPHGGEDDTAVLLHFNGTTQPAAGSNLPNQRMGDLDYVPGFFGAAFNNVKKRNLVYKSMLTGNTGTFESWLFFKQQDLSLRKQVLFHINGSAGSFLELFLQKNSWSIRLNNGSEYILKSEMTALPLNALLHVAVTWENDHVSLWINGLLKGSLSVNDMPVFNGAFELGGDRENAFGGLIDDVRLSQNSKRASAICPTGYVDTESAALDLMDSFDQQANSPLFKWTPQSSTGAWSYTGAQAEQQEDGCLQQANSFGLHAIIHPDAVGISSSIESGVIFNKLFNGWSGVVTNSNNKDSSFNGITFSINPTLSQLRLAIYKHGKITVEKSVSYDFAMKTQQRYTLTLSVYDNEIKGFVDGNHLISFRTQDSLEKGQAGLFTENAASVFDDVHFTALTPSNKQSRSLQSVIFTDAAQGARPEAGVFTYNAFRWKKRYGLLPWERLGKEPEPAGNIFGPDAGVQRPNPGQTWRSEDSANSDIMMVDGSMYYNMRGNPNLNGPHGSAALGMLVSKQSRFDGIHFQDLSADHLKDKSNGLLVGHRDTTNGCSDSFPRQDVLQINDQGMIYVPGKILVMAREFRNKVKDFPKFRRLVYGIFDIKSQKWRTSNPSLVSWSSMDPGNCFAEFQGIDGTPDLAMIRDPATNQPVILLFYSSGLHTMVTGLSFEGDSLKLHPGYPPKVSFAKEDGDKVYGQRIFFDNGIYYMNVNAGTDKSKLAHDWPDRFQLLSTLDPYSGSWTESIENTNKEKPYFSRGMENDPDNGAIWQGSMFKYRNQYYLYYENYHAIKDINNPYDNYDAVHSGSRVGYATGN